MGRASNRSTAAGIVGRFAQVLGEPHGRGGDVQAERAAELKAARAFGPLWMRLDDDRSEDLEAAALLYAHASVAKCFGGNLTADERHLLGSLPRYAVREAVAASQEAIVRAATVLAVEYPPLIPFVADDLAGYLAGHLQELVEGGMRPDLMAATVRDDARRVVLDNAALNLYRLAVAPDPRAAAQRLGVPTSKLDAATIISSERWQRALHSWLATGAQPGNARQYVTLHLKAEN